MVNEHCFREDVSEYESVVVVNYLNNDMNLMEKFHKVFLVCLDKTFLEMKNKLESYQNSSIVLMMMSLDKK